MVNTITEEQKTELKVLKKALYFDNTQEKEILRIKIQELQKELNKTNSTFCQLYFLLHFNIQIEPECFILKDSIVILKIKTLEECYLKNDNEKLEMIKEHLLYSVLRRRTLLLKHNLMYF